MPMPPVATPLRDTIAITAGGRSLALVGNHALYLQWYRNFHADSSALAQVTRGLPHGALVLDVGANIGVTAISMAVLRPDCSIIAFEPVPDNVDCLRRNIQANAIENVAVVEAAVSDRHGDLTMTDDGIGSTVMEGAPVRCRAVMLDDYADRPVAFVKIDIEGHEPYAFAGARRLFAARQPLVLTEFNAWAMLSAHCDPLAFAEVIMTAFDLRAVYYQERPVVVPNHPRDLLYQNVMEHGCINDLQLRPRAPMPDDIVLRVRSQSALSLIAASERPVDIALRLEVEALRLEVNALRRSTSWRVTAPLRFAKSLLMR